MPLLNVLDLIGSLILVLIGVIIILLIAKVVFFFLPAIIIAVIVWLFTQSGFWAGIAFLIIALISVLKRK